ncbi:guanine nucleotide-binding protein subunit beta 2 family 1 protein [Entamoeba histolytica HM-3:IMSS]|uniref:Guanine nucleotide-binding protein subunit beta 2 family 1 protein n=1 Tax=Entamoeba histolytica HM-3:IMSS TaxID=885315 RepID=M7WHQ2_ENTHI|nr:guanine nucleotide-binding protein subunit beta 2 family 1 protein [Entamoeba histolytica HM-3:IMSS]
MANKNISFELKSTLNGHNGAVTALAIATTKADTLVSGSRDKTLMTWKIDTNSEAQPEIIAPTKSLHGHSHFISDLVLSNDGQFAISSSWDHTLRLWDLTKMESVRRFVGHESDVMSVAFSADNTKILSSGRDKTIKLWNTLGKCVASVKTDSHSEWVSCVRFVPNAKGNKFVSAESTITHHTGFINTIAFSPDGSIMATAGKDGNIAFWTLNNGTGLYEFLYDVAVNCQVYQIVFAENPEQYTLLAATELGVVAIKDKEIVGFMKTSSCMSICLSATKDIIFTGHVDNKIRMWKVGIASSVHA